MASGRLPRNNGGIAANPKTSDRLFVVGLDDIKFSDGTHLRGRTLVDSEARPVGRDERRRRGRAAGPLRPAGGSAARARRKRGAGGLRRLETENSTEFLVARGLLPTRLRNSTFGFFGVSDALTSAISHLAL